MTNTRRTLCTASAAVASVLGLAGVAVSQEPAGEVAAIAVEKDAPFGEYLVDRQGRALYLFTPDRQAAGSTCYGACAEAWPPLTTEAAPRVLGAALKAEALGTITRRDGTKQVTYAGWPLYYYVRDDGPGEATGQDVHSFGGEWYLVSPAGQAIQKTRR